MLISSQNLLNLHVQTKSGQDLGKIDHFDIDIDTQAITKYHVKSSGIIESIIHNKELIINQSQIISITKKKIIVEDNVEQEAQATKQKKLPAREAVGVMSSKT